MADTRIVEVQNSAHECVCAFVVQIWDTTGGWSFQPDIAYVVVDTKLLGGLTVMKSGDTIGMCLQHLPDVNAVCCTFLVCTHWDLSDGTSFNSHSNKVKLTFADPKRVAKDYGPLGALALGLPPGVNPQPAGQSSKVGGGQHVQARLFGGSNAFHFQPVPNPLHHLVSKLQQQASQCPNSPVFNGYLSDICCDTRLCGVQLSRRSPGREAPNGTCCEVVMWLAPPLQMNCGKGWRRQVVEVLSAISLVAHFRELHTHIMHRRVIPWCPRCMMHLCL